MSLSRILPVLLLAVSLPGGADEMHRHGGGDPEQLGAAQFDNSCKPEAQPAFAQAVAMLHSFWYEEAGAQFRRATEADPGCAIAFWGIAMSHWQPLWEPRGPNPEAFAAGRSAIERAQQLDTGTPRERAFIAALARFYGDAERIDHRDRVLAYERAMAALHSDHPKDTEARAFYALSLLGSATSLPADKNYKRQKKAGELLMPVFRAQPHHPGAAHYIIHAYDYPALAQQALEAARRYAQIAPDSPHAQHMPSHIFTRLGLWDESIASNRNVIRVARKYKIVGEELHGMDYLVFAHLQKGEDEPALKVLRQMPQPKEGAPLYFAGVYARAVIPARYAIERGQWAEAAALPPPADLPGGRYAWANAAVHFARALGAARIGRAEQAAAEARTLGTLRATLEEHKEDYWATQVAVQEKAAQGWVAQAQGQPEKARSLLQAAVKLEDTTEKHPVTPGAIIPSRLLLAQLLFEQQRPAEALREFQRVLQAEPGRFMALHGAATAAQQAGDEELARTFYAQLLKQASDSRRPAVGDARAWMMAQAGK